jgi:23S rRNA (guanosine2251-2'-O)-methyltransferase
MTKRKHPGRSSGPVRPEYLSSAEGHRPPRPAARPAAGKRPEASTTADNRAEGGKWVDGRYLKAAAPASQAKGPGAGKRPDRRPEPGHYPKARPEAGKSSARPETGKYSPRPESGKSSKARPESRREPRHEPIAARAPAPATLGKGGGQQARGHWLYGLHAVKAALDNPRRKVLRLLATDEAIAAIAGNRSSFKEMYPQIAVESATRELISQLLPPHAVHQGAALLADPLGDVALEDVLDEVDEQQNAVILVLDQVTDPQNVGAILRSAAAFNVAAVVVPDRHSPPETAALAKAASGAIEMVPLVRVVNLARALELLKQAGFWTAGLAGEATQTLAAANLSGKIALVLGAEGEGLRRLTREHCDILVKLPISPRMESLNVSAAAAVALYELARKA